MQNVEKHSLRSGDGNGAALEKENETLKRIFLKYGKLSSTLKYRFNELSERMRITTSKDGNFRIYSWDNEFGGTMRDHFNIFQYRSRNGKVQAFLQPRRSDTDLDIKGFYHEIFQLDTVDGRVYLAVSTFIGSTSMDAQDLNVFRIEGEKLNSKLKLIRTKKGLTNSVGFGYDFFSVVDHPERPVKLFFFDEEKKSFRFPVVIEEKDRPGQGRVTNKFITYRFNGKYFVRI